jgi:hypothetical protein
LETEVLSGSNVKFLQGIEAVTNKFDFWKPAQNGASAKIMMSPEDFGMMTGFLQKLNIGYEIVMDDVQR